MVKLPYNKLYDITANSDGSFWAKVENEYLSEHEGAPICFSEAGRHIAILGSIAIAKNYNVPQHYILAIHGNGKRKTSKIFNSDFFNVTATTVSKSKHKARICGEICAENGEIIFVVEIEYQILS